MAMGSVVCALCSSRFPTLSLWLSHLRQVHRTDTDISLQCPVRGCSTTYKKVNSFCSHMYRQHREEITNREGSESASTFVGEQTSISETTGFSSTSATVGPISDELQHDVHQLLGIDSLEQLKKSSLFLLQLKEERLISQAAINDVVKGCKAVFEHTLGRVKAGVKYKLSQSGIDPCGIQDLEDVFSAVNDPFHGLETAYLQDKFISENLGCIVSSCQVLTPANTVLKYAYTSNCACLVLTTPYLSLKCRIE